MKHFLIIILSSMLFQCKKTDIEHKVESENFISDSDSIDDGIYCAEVDYYYPKTGTNSTYTLLVEVESNELTIIHWPNGGWLDDSHFIPQEISDGEVTFTSDRGVNYTVRIIGQEGDCNLTSNIIEEDELIWRDENNNNEDILNEETIDEGE